MKHFEQLQSFLSKLNGSGVFLTAGIQKPNTMTASWGFTGVMWGKSFLVIPVRPSRFTHGLITENKEFSVSIPLDNSLNSQLGYFGSVSGKNTDKYSAQNITPIKCKNIDTYIILGNCLQIECKLIYQNNILKDNLSENTIKNFYKDNSYHTMFYGEIVDIY